ncbi:PqiC family protein [Brytella acorum]|uniref:ABC-type transport auxiliary lipoprotein family protein n=1 Tax=Brytella acorum TaxID=2959299 RepID=A0AA35VCK5_9PROT|nr:ABC-type transport auxiliary lipoprotein family protein [Brytella acorum]MDF3625719.1 ABC-type transport auxiliary lipoprotein family protein [Brytella acorum]CAI9121690.1 ABC-type transport auxiliary lipoprotein family protein [Brytella acorum]
MFAKNTLVRRSVRLLATALIVSSLTACSADPTLYTLVPVSPAASTAMGLAPGVIEVRTPVVSQRLDRDDIVRRDRDYKLEIAKGDAWSEPIASMIGHALSQDLAIRLPESTVFSQNDAVSTVPTAYVELTVTAFNEDQAGNAVLQANLSTHLADAGAFPVLTVPVRLARKPDGSSTADLVAALSQMTGELADEAARRLRMLPAPVASVR